MPFYFSYEIRWSLCGTKTEWRIINKGGTRRAERDELYDANPGGANTVLQLQAYGQIAFEIYDELRDAPAAVAVPVSNGTTLAGIYRGFQSLHRRGKTSRMPKMVAGSSYGKNPIVRAFLKKLDRCEDLAPESIKETLIDEPLVNWHSIDGDLCLDAAKLTNGWAAYASVPIGNGKEHGARDLRQKVPRAQSLPHWRGGPFSS